MPSSQLWRIFKHQFSISNHFIAYFIATSKKIEEVEIDHTALFNPSLSRLWLFPSKKTHCFFPGQSWLRDSVRTLVTRWSTASASSKCAPVPLAPGVRSWGKWSNQGTFIASQVFKASLRLEMFDVEETQILQHMMSLGRKHREVYGSIQWSHISGSAMAPTAYLREHLNIRYTIYSIP